MLGITPDKSLFEILCTQLKEANNKYNVTIPWYIMTSKENNSDTIKFFEENDFFGYSKNDIMFFMQGELPMIDMEGKVLLDESGVIKEAADGHGGIFKAMFKYNVPEDMKKRKIEWMFIGTIDNPLAKLVDEVFIGMGIDKKCFLLGKSAVKKNPEERVGVFCKKNNKPGVVEYTEITTEMSNMRDEDGNLLYGDLHMVCNVFNIDTIERIGEKELPYHIAFKKATYMNKEGEIVTPNEPNSYKFESFIFDAFGEADDMIIFRVKREEEFAPVKNAVGDDSPETARKLYNDYHNKA